MSGKNSRLITLAGAGALTAATVVSATAATLPAGSAATSAGIADTSLLAVTQQHAVRVPDNDTMSAAQRLVAFDRVRFGLGDRQHEHNVAGPKAAAAKATPAAAGSPEQTAEQMLDQYGWSSSQFSCLYPLWEHESGWSVTAENPGSGAYGIPQALPGSQMASAGADWQTNAATQIKWGLTYIQDRYGSPCAAWAHEEADGWY